MAVAAIVLALTSMLTELPVEAPLIPDAVPLEEVGRYRSPRSYESTLTYYRRLFQTTGGVAWRNIVNLPSIKAKHVQSLRGETHWAGINIYEKNGETRIYVLTRESEPPIGPKEEDEENSEQDASHEDEGHDR